MSCEVNNRSIFWACNLLSRFPLAKIFIDNSYCLVGFKVARHTYSHIIWHIVAMIIVIDVNY